MQSTKDILNQFTTKLHNSKTLSELEKLRLDYLGRNGKVNTLLKDIKSIKVDDRKNFGESINKIKDEIELAIGEKLVKLSSREDRDTSFDITRPGKEYPHGSLHLATLAIDEISKIFEKIGFIRMSYPEVEWEYFSFDSLNMPPDHPARDDFETFFIEAKPHNKYGKMVLTPHTSSGQPREMKRLGNPPIRMINIAKTYRPNWDASHTPMFHQFEGLCVDKKINITHLKGTISYFAKEFFGEGREIRLRPFHFQFTEPSFEVDVTCGVCNGKGYVPKVILANEVRPESRSWTSSPRLSYGEAGQDDERIKCKLCKSGWLELGGSGMVHPSVLKAGGIDPDEYTGWAFGFGVERVFMMKEGLNLDDLRVVYSGDIRFLEQF